MFEQSYLDQVEELYISIEEWLEKFHPDIDFEPQENLLTIFLPNHQQAILSRQQTLQEIWLACPTGAYHFQRSQEKWITSDGHELMAILQTVIKGSSNNE